MGDIFRSGDAIDGFLHHVPNHRRRRTLLAMQADQRQAGLQINPFDMANHHASRRLIMRRIEPAKCHRRYPHQAAVAFDGECMAFGRSDQLGAQLAQGAISIRSSLSRISRAARTAEDASVTMRLAFARKSRPSAVSSTLRLFRQNKANPNLRSNSRIRAESAGWETLRS